MFTTNRYYKPNSAVYLKNGFLTVPHGVYFNQDFTISVWIKPYTYKENNRIIDFSNTISSNKRRDLISLGYSDSLSFKPWFNIIDENGNGANIDSSQELKLGEWSFVTAVLRETTGYIYINAQQTAVGKMMRPRNVVRVNNFIGRADHKFENRLANAVLDDLRIFNRALDLNEITALMNSNKNIF